MVNFYSLLSWNHYIIYYILFVLTILQLLTIIKNINNSNLTNFYFLINNRSIKEDFELLKSDEPNRVYFLQF